MKFNFKKVASVLASAAMLGSSMGIAAAASYPAPFVSGGAANVAIVVGASANTADMVAAADIASALSTELAKQTAGTTASGASSSGGDSVDLATSSQKLYFNSAMNAARTSLTNNEMPTLLTSGKAADNAGTEYPYKQTITLGSRTIQYSTSGGDMNDPTLLVEVGTTASSYLYQINLNFDKVINVSSSSVAGYSKIKMFGQEFTIGSSSTNQTVYLLGAGSSVSMNEGETKTVTVVGKDHTVELVGVSSATEAVIIVDGERKSVVEGSTYKFPGELEVYVKDLFYLSKTGSISSAELHIGAKKLKLVNASTVKSGTEETTILGTESVITGDGSKGDVSAISIKIAMPKSTKDYIGIGESFEDPVFGGLKVQFVGVNPALDSTSRDSITVAGSSISASVAFTSAISGKTDGFIYAYDNDLTSDSSVTARLRASGNKTIHVIEGENSTLNEYIVINAGDYGRILKVVDISIAGDTTDYVSFEDALDSTKTFKITTGSDGLGDINIDGQTYKINAGGTGTNGQIKVTWGAGADYGNTGTQTTLYPRIKLAKGEWLSFLTPANVSAGTTYVLPGAYLLSTYETGVTGNANQSLNPNWTSGNLVWRTDSNASGGIGMLQNIDFNKNNAITSADCVFNYSIGPAILIMEEKTLADSNGNAICIPLDTEGTTTTEISIGSPISTDTTLSLTQFLSNTNIKKGVDLYGTFVTFDSTGNDKATIAYPDDQMYADIFAASLLTTITAGTGTGTGVAALGQVTVLDSEVSTVSSKSLVVVGGACINTVAAKLLGSDTPICGAAWTTKTGAGAGEFIIETLNSPYATGKVATLVAGWEAADTKNAGTYLTTKAPATDVGKKYKGTSSTSATLVTA